MENCGSMKYIGSKYFVLLFLSRKAVMFTLKIKEIVFNLALAQLV